MNADDFGLSAGVNRGILEAHAAGVVSSVSVLVNTPGWTDGARLLRGIGPGLGVGLHLNLTTGRPVSWGGSLCDARTGWFHPLRRLIPRALAGRIDPGDIAIECTAQIARLRNAGLIVTHLDSHRHVHVLPGVWGPVVETARREGIQVVRVPLEPYSVNVMSWRALLKKATLRLAWSFAAGGASPLRRPDRFVGISLQGSPRFLRRLLALLDHLKPGTTELMVHPGHPDGDLAAWDDYTAPRARELAALTRPEVRERFRRGSFRLIHFGAL
ncbi:MAG: hypothetical protein AUH45_10745 [Gemmatimonadetes bacterium 13_1_40CM_69_22]|nr:MAG: hypothetical protein AUH45_10745 [Gemmatimonadetes bacterium 13_1_40CM_69_22]